MSGKCTGWVLANGPRPDDLDSSNKPYGFPKARAMRAVLVAIADAANSAGTHAHPGLAAIIEAALYSRRQVLRVTSDLISEGWLSVESAGGGAGVATVYTVHMDRRNGVTTAPLAEETVPLGEENGAIDSLGTVPSDDITVPSPCLFVPSTVSTTGQATNGFSDTNPAIAEDLVFTTWRESTGKPRAVLDSKRRSIIRKALAAHPLEDVIAAVQGWKNSPWHSGKNDKGAVYNDIELLLRNAGKIEYFRDMWLNPPRQPVGGPRSTGNGWSEADRSGPTRVKVLDMTV